MGVPVSVSASTGAWSPFLTSNFRPSFDVVAELSTNRDRYMTPQGTPSSPVTIYGFPQYLLTLLLRVRSAVEEGSRPGLSPTICCCLEHALDVLRSHPEVQELLVLRERHIRTPTTRMIYEYEQISAILRDFDISVPDRAGMRPIRQNLTLTEGVKKELSVLAGELGVSLSSLCIIGVVITLSQQPEVFESRRAEMREDVETFFERVAARKRMYEDVLAGIERRSGK